jgi:tetratricopeptide (TPR) repeat protein
MVSITVREDSRKNKIGDGRFPMNAYARICEKSRVAAAVSLVALLGIAVGLSGCNKLKARDLLNKGVASFRNGQYDNSIEDFKQAKALDPTLLNARLYLATAYATEYIPGAPSDENIRMGQQAISEFKDVLSIDPNNVSAIDGIGSILFQMAGTPFTPSEFEESKQYHMKHIALRPGDPEPYYWVGVVDWTLAYRSNAELRLQYNLAHPRKQLQLADPLPKDLRGQYTQESTQLVDQGLDMLNKAIALRPDYADAMAYKSLLLRQKADMSDESARADLEKEADGLLNKVKEIKEEQAAKAAAKAS